MSVDIRLAVSVVVAWVTVGILLSMPDLLSGAALALWFAAVIVIVLAIATHGRVRAVLTGVVVALAATALLVSVAAARAPERQPELLVEAAHAGRFITATATVTQTVQAAKPAEASTLRQAMFSANLGSVTMGGRTLVVDIPVTVFADRPGRAIGIGATVALSGTLSATDPADDAAFRLFAARGARVETAAPLYLDWANGLRSRFRDAADSLPGDGGDLLTGLAIGDTSAVGVPLDSAMKATSLSHLTAVSGDTVTNIDGSLTCEQVANL